MSSPTNSLLGRIANAVASPFYTRTRNKPTATSWCAGGASRRARGAHICARSSFPPSV